MFHSDFVALPGNHTRNFVARHKLGFNATSSLCVRIKLTTSLLEISYVSTRPRRFGSDSNSQLGCSTYVRFQRDFVALGQNQTHNFVARYKLCFNATSSLWVRIKLTTSLLDISYVSTRLRRSAWESNSWF